MTDSPPSPKQAYRDGITDATLTGMARDLAALRSGQDRHQKAFNSLPDTIRQTIEDTVSKRLDSHSDDIKELSKRMSSLEKWRWTAHGSIIVIVLIITKLPQMLGSL